MNALSQALTALCWTVIALTLALMIWLFLYPYLKFWSRAERRANILLRDTLTPEQLRQLAWHGYLEVPSPTEPRRVYRVPRAKGYMQVFENGCSIMRLCLPPVEWLPDADIVVLHKLLIEANEETYLQKANKYRCFES